MWEVLGRASQTDTGAQGGGCLSFEDHVSHEPATAQTTGTMSDERSANASADLSNASPRRRPGPCSWEALEG